ncbi:hypothetical protein WMY93_031111 [Mugilogobius chulae]|uniref:Uncharacterized protein n=1 Tax=Mugilogobius chulae TaxID=88201 RepID=A0AAW0MH03_9GOBI
MTVRSHCRVLLTRVLCLAIVSARNEVVEDARLNERQFSDNLVKHLAVISRNVHHVTSAARQLSTWEAAQHHDCNCVRALLDYYNPVGLCSPACIHMPFRHITQGLMGDEWTLRVTRGRPDTSQRGEGRVLYGSVPPTIETFCPVTADVFKLLPGFRVDAPHAPIDVAQCGVVLLELTVWVGESPVEAVGKSRALPRSRIFVMKKNTPDKPGLGEKIQPSSGERANETRRALQVSQYGVDTLQAIIKQGWGAKVGVKVRFCVRQGNTVCDTPQRDDLVALLEWLSAFDSLGHGGGVRVVVVEINPETVKTEDFSWTVETYDSKFEMIPCVSSGKLAEMIGPQEYTGFECQDEARVCVQLTRVLDRSGRLLARRAVGDSVPPCRVTPAPVSNSCLICQEEHLTVVCPKTVWPVRFLCNRTSPMRFRRVTAMEPALRELGSLVARHGAFLDLDTVSQFSAFTPGCENVTPGRWISGDYDPKTPFKLRLLRHEEYVERMGLVVFEELCFRSNNRAGIIVSVPSSGYRGDSRCGAVELINRDEARVPSPGAGRLHRYSLFDLQIIISDMAKWGVRRYSLGYLEYSHSGWGGESFLVKLSRHLTEVTNRELTLHYSYTRGRGYGDGDFSSAHVQGVYKLYAGLFFQHVVEGEGGHMGFASVPGVPDLRLGLSSDMNIGAPLDIREMLIGNTAEEVRSLPGKVRLVDLNYRGKHAFVDLTRRRICVYTPVSRYQSPDSRFPVWMDVRPSRQEGECQYRMTKAAYYARVAIHLGKLPGSRRDYLLSALPKLQPRFPARPLSETESRWLQDDAVDPAGIRALAEFPQFAIYEAFIECVTSSLAGSAESCADLGSNSVNGWPQGGLGYAVAGALSERGNDGVSVRLIVRAEYGGATASVPCELIPLSLSPLRDLASKPWPGFYTQKREPHTETTENVTALAVHLASGLVRPLHRLFCGSLTNERRSPCHIYAKRAESCMDEWNAIFEASRDSFFDLWDTTERDRREQDKWTEHGSFWVSRDAGLRCRGFAMPAGAPCALLLSISLHLAHFGVLPCATASAETDHRVVLQPGVWRIRTPQTGGVSHVAYHFILGPRCTGFKFDLPQCSQVACEGPHNPYRGCDHLCSTGSWMDARFALETAADEFDRIVALLRAALDDMVALADRYVSNPDDEAAGAVVSELLALPLAEAGTRAVDVLSEHRDACESLTLGDTLSTDSVYTWKSVAFKLAVQLNAATFALHRAHSRISSCSRGMVRSDMTGCNPEGDTDYSLVRPVASTWLHSSSALVLVVRKEAWTPVSLSRWYMPFVDESRGRRVCWLNRPMLSDEGSNYTWNYRVPECDSRGMCSPLEIDERTVAACTPDGDGEIGPGCPLICDQNCFGPLCYDAVTDAYSTRAWVESSGLSVVRMHRSPRLLSRALSLSASDLRKSLVWVLARASQAAGLLNRGELLLREMHGMNISTILHYAETVRSGTETCEALHVRVQMEMARAFTVATLTLIFSMVTVCLSVMAFIKTGSARDDRRKQTIYTQ